MKWSRILCKVGFHDYRFTTNEERFPDPKDPKFLAIQICRDCGKKKYEF
jgi:hypothetical protein